MVVSPEELVIVGDFNFHVEDVNNSHAMQFTSLLEFFYLKQWVTKPTHRCGHILDLVITRSADIDASFVHDLCVLEQPISDLKAVCFNLRLQKPPNERKTVIGRKLKNIDFDSFDDAIVSSGLLDEDTCLSSVIDKYDTVLRMISDKLAPIKTRTITIHPNAQWYNDGIANEKRKRRRLERKWRAS